MLTVEGLTAQKGLDRAYPLSKQRLPRFLPKKLTQNLKIEVLDLSRWRVYILMRTHILMCIWAKIVVQKLMLHTMRKPQ